LRSELGSEDAMDAEAQTEAEIEIARAEESMRLAQPPVELRGGDTFQVYEDQVQ
jgi:hypothetical protein